MPLSSMDEHRASGRRGLSFQLRPADSLECERDAWRDLADHAVEDNAFFAPGFLLAAARHLADTDVSLASLVAPDGSWQAAMPVVQGRLAGVIQAVRVWVHDYGPLGTPLVRRGDVRETVAALIDGLTPAGSGAALVVPTIDLDGPVASALTQIAHEKRRPVAILEEGARAIFERGGDDPPLSRHHRKDLARQLRRLGERGEIAFRSYVGRDEVRAHVGSFLLLEASGWKGQAGTALASHTDTAQFVRKAVFERAVRGGARIDSLEIDGRPVAMALSFVHGQTSFAWKIAFDETMKRYSPGAQLLRKLPELVLADPEIQRLDSCADAGHELAERLLSGRMRVGTLAISPLGGGSAFHLAVAAARGGLQAREAVRRLRDSGRKVLAG